MTYRVSTWTEARHGLNAMEAGEMVQTICRDGGSCVVVDEASAMTVKAIGPDGPSLAARERGNGAYERAQMRYETPPVWWEPETD